MDIKELEDRLVKSQEKVDKAIQRLIKAQKAINFNSVANESGITKKTLYDNKDMKNINANSFHSAVIYL